MVCETVEAAAAVSEGLLPLFAIGKLAHEEKIWAVEVAGNSGPDDLSIVQRTGGDCPIGIGSMFELKKGDKVIGKSLCSYYNGEMGEVGPTIEYFEIAEEWRKHGYGRMLLGEVEDFFVRLFGACAEDGSEVQFNVCNVTNGNASVWFLNQGFEDLDGMGEELGKMLPI